MEQDQPVFPYDSPGECEVCHNQDEDYTPEIENDEGHDYLAGWTCDKCGAYYAHESKYINGRWEDYYTLEIDTEG